MTVRGIPGPFGRVRTREWTFPLLVAVLLLAIAWTPYGIAFRKTPASDQFMGLIGQEAEAMHGRSAAPGKQVQGWAEAWWSTKAALAGDPVTAA